MPNPSDFEYLEEGYVKFQSEWIAAPPLPYARLASLFEVRQQMFQQGWIGHHPVLKVGYGNISQRVPEGNGICDISGTQTGHLAKLSPQEMTTVTEVRMKQNWLRCEGPIQASSESMTHVAVYQASEEIAGVIHIHDLALWQRMLHQLPTTDPTVPYGSPEMAAEVGRLFRETNVSEIGVLVMGGHEEGLIGFGHNLTEAAARLFALLK